MKAASDTISVGNVAALRRSAATWTEYGHTSHARRIAPERLWANGDHDLTAAVGANIHFELGAHIRPAEGTAVRTSVPRQDAEQAIAHLASADRLPMSRIVAELVDWVGLGLTAMAGGVQETRFVDSWLEGGSPRRAASLRAAWCAAYVITSLCGSETAKAWFIGQKREFDFRSPIRVLQENTDPARAAVVRAAVWFATT